MSALRQVVIITVLFFSLAGCSPPSRTPLDKPKLESLPAVNSSEIGAWADRYQGILSSGSVDPHLRIPEKEIQDIVVLYLSSNREFDSTEGMDGYVLQITPLGTNEKPRAFSGKITVFLQAIPCPAPSGNCPYLRVWHISKEQLGNTWRRTRLLDGYVLPLHWGESSLPEGNYRFQIVVESALENRIYYAYRELTISDNR